MMMTDTITHDDYDDMIRPPKTALQSKSSHTSRTGAMERWSS